ncbi:MAG: TonB-dependent receptor [Cyclobacteriaceae bacterium]|nr:TonB-dependent receptor [Cyclobacteriaceae bacterium]MCH8516722.1 TonB-dependent receptor [Cyclobacteriaceae bacterium]
MKKHLQLIKFSLILILVGSRFVLQAQQTISGVVKDKTGSPLPFTSVLVVETKEGTVTDTDGEFSLSNLSEGEYTLRFTQVGHVPQNVKVNLVSGEDTKLEVVLKDDALNLNEVVVTGVSNPISKLESSVSITTIKSQAIIDQAPANTAELFRTIPGVRAEASAGEGNTNITVRGVPISSGGSKYLQLQEDGLPLLQFGDISFGTADIFLRADQTIDRIEAIRGGSASTMASNSPAGIINFISKTGAKEGGSVVTNIGLNFDNLRTDFEYGAPINETMSFHVGGFYRQGVGPRDAGFNAQQGGQIKANLTKNFKKGYARVYYKYLNDRTPAFLPLPMQVSGTNSNPSWSSIPGFDALRGTMHSPFFTSNLSTGGAGDLRRSNVMTGMNPISNAIGAEYVTELGDGWSLESRTRMAYNSGQFVSPFPAEVGNAQGIAESIAGPGASLAYADGSAFGNGHAGNNLLMRLHLFDADLNDFNLFANDFKLNKNLNDLDLTFGYYRSVQNISMSWVWNSYLFDVNGVDARPVNVFSQDGTAFSTNGLYAYGTPFWGNLHRNYDTQHTTSAPYFAASYVLDNKWFFDGSLRYEMGMVNGSFAGGSSRTFDMNNDGAIAPYEQDVFFIDNENRTPVDYTYNHLSYSAGINYKIDEDQAIFARYSNGVSAKADRILFQGLPYSGGVDLNAIDIIDQAEIGWKRNFSNAAIFLTAFYAETTEEGGFELTTLEIIDNNYRAFGLELEGALNFNNFDLRGGVTYTNATIVSGDDDGNMPRRQPAFMYFLTPTYQFSKSLSLGSTIIGQTGSYTQDTNELWMPGYLFVNGFLRYQINESLSVAINGNNIFNALGLTEAEEASIMENSINFVRARPITGRTIGTTLIYRF